MPLAIVENSSSPFRFSSCTGSLKWIPGRR